MTTTWDPKLYQDRHAFVWQKAAELLEWLKPQAGEHILDLGCGTGQLTQSLQDEGVNVIGMDGDAVMIQSAKENYPDVPFYCVDARKFTLADFNVNQPFDSIFSNAVLHWVKPPEPVIDCMANALKPGGRLVAEMGGEKNMAEVITAITQALAEYGCTGQNPWFFPSPETYETLLEDRGFEVHRMIHFERPTPLAGEDGLANWVRMFGNVFLVNVPEADRPAVLSRVQDIARPRLYKDGQWVADYWRLRFEAVRVTS